MALDYGLSLCACVYICIKHNRRPKNHYTQWMAHVCISNDDNNNNTCWEREREENKMMKGSICSFSLVYWHRKNSTKNSLEFKCDEWFTYWDEHIVVVRFLCAHLPIKIDEFCWNIPNGSSSHDSCSAKQIVIHFDDDVWLWIYSLKSIWKKSTKGECWFTVAFFLLLSIESEKTTTSIGLIKRTNEQKIIWKRYLKKK